MLNANLILPWSLAENRETSTWHFTLNQLDARVTQSDCFADLLSEITATIRGGIDDLNRHYADVCLKGELSLICQRCLHAMPFTLNNSVRILFCKNEASADLIDDEDADVLVVGETADVREWIEDQLLTALPFAPMHQSCDENHLMKYHNDKHNPFSVLKNIKP